MQGTTGAPCAGGDLGYGCLCDRQETFPSVERPWHLFLLTLTDFSAAARTAAKVFEERAGRMEGKGNVQQCSMRARHLTCHTHPEKSPLPSQLQLMQIHLKASIFATQHFKKKAGGNQTCCFLRRSGNIHSQALSKIIHYTFLSIPLTACVSPACLRKTDTLVLYPVWENCIDQRGTPISVGLLS